MHFCLTDLLYKPHRSVIIWVSSGYRMIRGLTAQLINCACTVPWRGYCDSDSPFTDALAQAAPTWITGTRGRNNRASEVPQGELWRLSGGIRTQLEHAGSYSTMVRNSDSYHIPDALNFRPVLAVSSDVAHTKT